MRTLQVIEIQDGYTFEQLQQAISEAEGRNVPRSTLIDWITRVCLLNQKDWYSSADYEWLTEWVVFKRQFPERSTKKVKAFHEYLRSKASGRTNDRAA